MTRVLAQAPASLTRLSYAYQTVFSISKHASNAKRYTLEKKKAEKGDCMLG